MTTTKTTAEKATTKQINFILKLNPEAKMEEIQDLTKKQASWMIHELLKTTNTQETTKTETKAKANLTLVDVLKATNWDELEKKYKAYTTYGKQYTGGPVVYNDNNGANSNSELLKDMRKLKAYISNILKTEFKGLLNFKINVKTSRHWALSDEIRVTVTAPHDEMCKTFAELARKNEDHDSMCRFWEYSNYIRNHGTLSNTKVNIYYKYYASRGNVIYKHLKDDFQKLYTFIDELLGSFSYDHSDIMTDYFDYGLSYHVDFCTIEEQDKNAQKIFDDNADESLFSITEQEKEDYKKAVNEWQEEFTKQCEEQRKKEEAERIEREKQEEENKKKHAEAEKDAKIEELPENEKFYCKVSMACKPCNIQEINKWQENEKTYYITHLVKFTKQETWDNFKNNLLKDWSFFSGQSLGGWEYIDAKTQKPLTQEEQEKAYKEHCAGVLPDSILCRPLAVLAVGTDNDYLVIDPSGSSYCRYAGIYCPSQEQTYNNQGETKALLA